MFDGEINHGDGAVGDKHHKHDDQKLFHFESLVFHARIAMFTPVKESLDSHFLLGFFLELP